MTKEQYMKRIQDRQNRSWDGIMYSIQRIDLLIIAISGASIYVILETMKYLRTAGVEIPDIIKWSGGLFLGAIIFNFIGQWYGKKANEEDYLMCETKLEEGYSENSDLQVEAKQYDDKSDKFTDITTKTENISILLMFSGLILIMGYFIFLF